jgi:hypothetical protein
VATRFYFPASTLADVSPAFGTWDGTSQALRRKMVTTKGTSAITAGSIIDVPTTGNGQGLDRQYVSAPIAAQTISGTAKGYLMVREYATGDNVDRIYVRGFVVSNDGTTARGSFLCFSTGSPNFPAALGPTAEFISNATHRNKVIADGDTLTQNVITQDGDRIVLEIGYSHTSGTSPQASAKWGENAADLPENETQTSDGAGWFELSMNIAFQSAGAVPYRSPYRQLLAH